MAGILDKNRIIKTPIKQFGGAGGIAKLNQPFIMDLTTMEYLVLMGLPSEISIDPQPGWYAVESAGRNVPLYQYTGSETTITFTISWYSQLESREDVIAKCKWLEGLTLNDGYDDPPHEVMVCFGKVLSQGKFIVKKAPYKLGLFHRQESMYPQVAVQEITICRVASFNPGRSLMTSTDY